MAKTPNLRLSAIDQVFYLYGSLEIFSAAGGAILETYVDRNRLTFGIGWIINKKWRAEIVYIRQNAREGTEDGFENNVNIFRFRFRYFLNPQF